MKSARDSIVDDMFHLIGREHGCDDVRARFYPFKEFKSTWCRNGGKVEFKISDYLQHADAGVLEDFSRCLFSRISNKGRKEVYTERLRSWLQSKEFISMNRSLYLERSRNLSLSPAGRFLNLKEIHANLKDKGLIQDSSDAVLSWTISRNVHRVGYCSVIMRVIGISSVLDTPSIPDFVAEYVLYHEILHLESGLASLASGHDRDFRVRERMYPNWRIAEDWLKKVATGKIAGT